MEPARLRQPFVKMSYIEFHKKKNTGFSSWSYFTDGKVRWADDLRVFGRLYEGKAIPVTGSDRTRVFQEVEVP